MDFVEKWQYYSHTIKYCEIAECSNMLPTSFVVWISLHKQMMKSWFSSKRFTEKSSAEIVRRKFYWFLSMISSILKIKSKYMILEYNSRIHKLKANLLSNKIEQSTMTVCRYAGDWPWAVSYDFLQQISKENWKIGFLRKNDRW